MYRYRIYTENKDIPYIKYRVSQDFTGFTLFYGTEYYEEAEEQSVTIEIVDNAELAKVKELAEDIKAHNCQQAVLVTQEIIKHVVC